MPEGGFLKAGDGLSWNLYAIAAGAIAKSFLGGVDPEDTLMVQLTTPEVGMLTLGSLLASRIFPELIPVSLVLQDKLIELSDVQEFFTQPEDDSPSNEGS